MKFINYSVVKFSIFLSFGILAAHFLSKNSYHPHYIGLGCIFLFIICWYIAQKSLQPSVLFGISTYCCFFYIGFSNYQLRLPHFKQYHYSNFITKDDSQCLQIKIKEVLKPDLYHYKYIAETEAVHGSPTEGRILFAIQKDAINPLIEIDEVLLVDSKISEVPQSLNPYQFAYSNYLKTLGIHHQVKMNQLAILNRSKGVSTLRGLSEKIRNHIINKLEKTSLKSDERSIAQALVLGQRKDIDNEIYMAYAAAGAIHILAVSGLHIGILYLLLVGMLRPLKHLRYGNFLVGLLILCFLWGFAMIAGLSPSVVRAVTMFSFFTFAQASRRPTNSINTLFLSYFTLILINPFWLFHVGFQLSYLAVFFILWIQPLLYQLYYPKNYLLKKSWGIFTVTIAAQLGVAPLSLYYFHQFPGLFLVTNLVVLPFLGILLIGGIIVVVLATFDVLPNGIAQLYNWLVEVLNIFIGWIAQQEAFLFDAIPFSELKVIASYLIIISIVLLWKRFTYSRIVYCLICFGFFTGVLLFEKVTYSGQQFVVLHKSRQTLLAYKNGASLSIFRSDSISGQAHKFPLKNYKVSQHIRNISKRTIPSVFTFNNNRILILDSLGVYPTIEKIDVVILTQSPKVNLDRLLDQMQPKLILGDGSNYTSYISRWRNTCKKRKIPFHHTGTEGAFVLDH